MGRQRLQPVHLAVAPVAPQHLRRSGRRPGRAACRGRGSGAGGGSAPRRGRRRTARAGRAPSAPPRRSGATAGRARPAAPRRPGRRVASCRPASTSSPSRRAPSARWRGSRASARARSGAAGQGVRTASQAGRPALGVGQAGWRPAARHLGEEGQDGERHLPRRRGRPVLQRPRQLPRRRGGAPLVEARRPAPDQLALRQRVEGAPRAGRAPLLDRSLIRPSWRAPPPAPPAPAAPAGGGRRHRLRAASSSSSPRVSSTRSPPSSTRRTASARSRALSLRWSRSRSRRREAAIRSRVAMRAWRWAPPLLVGQLAERLARAEPLGHDRELGQVAAGVGGVDPRHEVREPPALGLVLGQVGVQEAGEAAVDPLQGDLGRLHLGGRVRLRPRGRGGRPAGLAGRGLGVPGRPRPPRCPWRPPAPGATPAAARLGLLQAGRLGGERVLQPKEPAHQPLGHARAVKLGPRRRSQSREKSARADGEPLQLQVERGHLVEDGPEPRLQLGRRTRCPRRRTCPPAPGRRGAATGCRGGRGAPTHSIYSARAPPSPAPPPVLRLVASRQATE